MRQRGVPAERHPRGPADGRAWVLLVAVWALLFGVVVGTGWLLRHQATHAVGEVDLQVSRWFAGHRTSWLTTLADVAQVPGNTITGQVVLLALALGWSIWRRSLAPLAFVALVDAGLIGIYLGAGYLDPRFRPPVPILDPGLVPDHSFPSGHVSTAVSICGSVVVLARRYTGAARRAAPLLLVPLCTLLARLYQGAHYLTDVLTTLIYATVWLLVVSAALGWTAAPVSGDAGPTTTRRSTRAPGPLPATGGAGSHGGRAVDARAVRRRQ